MFQGNQVFGLSEQVGSLESPREEKAAGTPCWLWLWLPSLGMCAD